MDMRLVAIWLGFTVGAMSIFFAVLIVVLWFVGKQPKNAAGRCMSRRSIGMLFSIGCMQLLSAPMFAWPLLTILPWAVIASGAITMVFALTGLSPLFMQALRSLDELSTNSRKRAAFVWPLRAVA